MKKLLFEDVKNYIENENITLLSNKWKNSKTKLEMKCGKCNHIFHMFFYSFKSGQRCPKCGMIKKSESQKLSIVYIRNYIEKENYQLLSTEYINAGEYLIIRCDKGHKYKTSWMNFQQGYRCPECATNKKPEFDFIKECIEKENYCLLSNEYANAHKKLIIKCDKGHVYMVNWNNFKSGKRCPICNGGIKYKYKYIKENIEKKNFQLISDSYINSKNKLDIKCDKGHIFKMSYITFNKFKRCPICSRTSISKKEMEVSEFIKQIYKDEILTNVVNIIKNPKTGYWLELDIYLPKIKFAIEFNGDYWHSLPVVRKRDKIKLKECQKLNIDLLVIKENDWNTNKEKCKGEIVKWIEKRSWLLDV